MIFIIIAGIIVLVLLFLLGVRFHSEWEEKKKCDAAFAILPQANAEFTSLCNPDRNFTFQEERDYKAKYSDAALVIIGYGVDKFIKKYSKKFAEAGLSPDTARTFVNNYKNISQLREFNNFYVPKIIFCNNRIEELYIVLSGKYPSRPNINQYFTSSEAEHILFKYKELIAAFKAVYMKYKDHLTFSKKDELFLLLQNLEQKRVDFNHFVYIPKFLDDNKDYFEKLLPYPLDEQQRKAIVTDEDNTLVISSAGSGKTSTIIGKARYLLDKHNIDPKKILILTYTRKAAAELVERLGNDEVDCSTFHSLAVRILGKLESKKPSICEPSLLLNIFQNLLQKDNKFLKAVLHYILHLQSLMKLEHEYEKAPDYFADRKKYGIQAPYKDFRGNVIFTKSEEEKRICTFLAELGVPFLYEEPYQFNTFTTDYRQYKPDFTIFVKETYIDPVSGSESIRERKVYLEHFAIDENGNVPKWFGDKDPLGNWYTENKKYNDGIRWKRDLHRDKGTTLIETKSADFHSGNILEVIKQQLRSANVPINPPTAEELYSQLVKRSKKIENSVFKLFEQFIALLKSNCGSIQPFIDRAKRENDKRTEIILSDVIRPLLLAYSAELQRRGEIDYTDAIIGATNYCVAGAWNHYDYILVDEFQDISVDRYHFLQFLRSKNPITKLFCVGDDWQSIYRFAGSNMRLFYKFEEYFGFTEHCKIEKTYRFFNPLLDLSSDFVQRNPEQMKKEVKSNGKPLPPIAAESTLYETQVVKIDGQDFKFRVKDIPAVQEWLNKYHTSFEFHDCGPSDLDMSMLRFVESIVRTIPKEETILIIGRYNYDVRSIGYNLDEHDFNRNRERIDVVVNGRKIRFMSVHAAKGLEADNVILLNCNEGIYGFPSLVEDDPILGYVLSEEDLFEYAEERRLFYVALTRARKHIHILYNGDKPSPFVRELTNVLKTEQKLCPVCQEGHVVVIKNGVASNGNQYTNYGCSNANAGCEYFERVFEGDTPRFEIFNERYKREQKAKKLAEQKAKLESKQTERKEPNLEELIRGIKVPPMPDLKIARSTE